MQQTVEQRDGALVLALEGAIGIDDAAGLRHLLLETVAGGRPVIVDLAGVERIDTAALAGMVEALDAAVRQRTGLILAAPGLKVRRLLELVGLDEMFGLQPSVNEALEALRT